MPDETLRGAPDRGEIGPAEKLWAVLVSAVVVVLVALPGVRTLAEERPADGFPLSTYPMFSDDPGRVVTLPTVVAVAPGGEVTRLSPRTIAGTDQVIQASAAVRDALRRGPAATRELCAEVAGRVETPGRVAVVQERHDAIGWSSDSSSPPLRRRVVASCAATG